MFLQFARSKLALMTNRDLWVGLSGRGGSLNGWSKPVVCQAGPLDARSVPGFRLTTSAE